MRSYSCLCRHLYQIYFYLFSLLLGLYARSSLLSACLVTCAKWWWLRARPSAHFSVFSYSFVFVFLMSIDLLLADSLANFIQRTIHFREKISLSNVIMFKYHLTTFRISIKCRFISLFFSWISQWNWLVSLIWIEEMKHETTFGRKRR